MEEEGGAIMEVHPRGSAGAVPAAGGRKAPCATPEQTAAHPPLVGGAAWADWQHGDAERFALAAPSEPRPGKMPGEGRALRNLCRGGFTPPAAGGLRASTRRRGRGGRPDPPRQRRAESADRPPSRSGRMGGARWPDLAVDRARVGAGGARQLGPASRPGAAARRPADGVTRLPHPRLSAHRRRGREREVAPSGSLRKGVPRRSRGPPSDGSCSTVCQAGSRSVEVQIAQRCSAGAISENRRKRPGNVSG